MDPVLRRGLILDRTAALIAREGVSAVSMERVGREAGISKALVYSHFLNRTVLLQDLLVREQHKLLELQTDVVGKANDLEDLIRLTTQAYLQHVQTDGLHIQRLMNEPTVAVAFQELEKRERLRAVEYLSVEIAAALNVPRDIAVLATELSMGMTGAAGELLSSRGVSRERIEEVLFCLFSGAITALTTKYRQA